MSLFVLDASYALTWCFPDRSTPNTDAALQHGVPYRQCNGSVGVAGGSGECARKGGFKGQNPLPRALEIWDELLLLPIRQVAVGNVPELVTLAVKHNLSVYDTCYLQLALVSNLPIATNDEKLKRAAEASGLVVIVP